MFYDFGFLHFWKWNSKTTAEKIVELREVPYDKVSIPKDWYVYEMGQDLTHGLWFCTLVYLGKPPEGMPKHVSVEEEYSLWEALRKAVQRIYDAEYKIAIVNNLAEELEKK